MGSTESIPGRVCRPGLRRILSWEPVFETIKFPMLNNFSFYLPTAAQPRFEVISTYRMLDVREIVSRHRLQILLTKSDELREFNEYESKKVLMLNSTNFFNI